MGIDRRGFLKASAASGAMLGASALMPKFATAQGADILVGGLHDETGGLDFAGKPMQQVLGFAVDEINAQGGLLGRKLKLIGADTQSNMQLYASLAQQVALKDKVSVVHGGITSASREVIRPALRRFNTLYFYNTLYEGGVCDRNCFCTGTTPAQTVQKLVPHVMKKWGKKVYTIAADYNYGQITSAWVKKYVEENGGQVLSTDFFPLDVTNFGPTIQKIQAAKPDLVMSVLVGAAHLGFYRQWAAAGMKKQIPIASTTFGAGGTEPILITPEESEGIISCYGYYPTIDTPANKAFKAKVQAKLGAAPPAGNGPLLTELSVCTYEGMMLWAAGVKKAGTLDRMKVIEALESGISLDMPSGKVTIDPVTHHVTRDVYLADLKNREFVILESFAQQPPADTQAVCDLKKNPNENQHYQIKL
ncbi:ABC transporter substrate-binding protein [Desertibaculum subflavum]|uniref:ABC transporter substrate-binding protein n=1 Tax=Desertibaculum subflavum TaxID=2268458 RepID=UPI000E675CA7